MVDRCDTDTGVQATSYGGHKFTVLIGPVFFTKGLSTLDVQKVIIKKDSKEFFLRLVSAIFYQISIFLSNDRPSKTMKNIFYFI